MSQMNEQTIAQVAQMTGLTIEDARAQIDKLDLSQLVAAPANAEHATPKVPLAVTLAIGLAHALNGAEANVKAAKDATKASWSLFKATYREKRPAEVKVVKAADVSPEELAAAVEILKQQNAQ